MLKRIFFVLAVALGVVAVATIIARIPILKYLPLSAVVAIMLVVYRVRMLYVVGMTLIVTIVLDIAMSDPFGVRGLFLLAAFVIGAPLARTLYSGYRAGAALILAFLFGLAEYTATVFSSSYQFGLLSIAVLLPGLAMAIGMTALLAILFRHQTKTL